MTLSFGIFSFRKDSRATECDIVKVTLPDGTARLTVPSGTLDDEFDITVGVLRETTEMAARLDDGVLLLSEIVSFLPNGQQFNKPVEIEIPHSASDLVISDN